MEYIKIMNILGLIETFGEIFENRSRKNEQDLFDYTFN